MPASTRRTAHQQAGAGPGHAHEQQPPFLSRIRAGVRGRAGQPERQQPLLAAGQEDDLELQPLGRVQGQQRDRVGAGIEGIDLRAERDLGPELLHVVAAPAGERGQDFTGRAQIGAGQAAPARGRGPGRVRGCGEPADHVAQLVGDRGPRRDRSGAAARGRLGQGQLPEDLRHPGAPLQQVVGALLERQPGPGQPLAERRGLCVGPVQHGDVGEPEGAVAVAVGAPAVERVERGSAEQPVDGLGDPGRLARRVGGLVEADPGAGSVLRGGPQHPARNQGGGRDGLHGPGHDARAGAVVGRERHRGRPGVVLPEPQEETHVRTAEPVDGLVRIPDHGEARPVPGEQPQQRVLFRIDVLVLVDADPRPPLAEPGGHRRRPVQHRDGQLDQAVEVDQVPDGQAGPQHVTPLRVGGRPGQQGPSAARRSGQLRGHLEHRLLVGDREVGRQPGELVILAQDHQPEPVEGGHRQLRGARAEQPGQALAHLLRGPPGEGERQAGPGRHALLGHGGGEAVGQRARLAGTRPGDDHQRRGGGRGGPLLRVEPVQPRAVRGFPRRTWPPNGLTGGPVPVRPVLHGRPTGGALAGA